MDWGKLELRAGELYRQQQARNPEGQVSTRGDWIEIAARIEELSKRCFDLWALAYRAGCR
jgi:hypothetical protein